MPAHPKRRLPRALDCAGAALTLRLLGPGEDAALLAFARQLPAHDLLALRHDITQPQVVAAWLRAVAEGSAHTVVACDGSVLAGCATLVREQGSWSAHVGDLDVIVGTAWRGAGLGRRLTQECFAIALELGLEKLTAQMTIDQRAALEVFEDLGFRAEALLRNHVQDRRGTRHDLVILCHDVARVQAQSQALGLPRGG